ncbi:penicillin-binding transpeptidase domain-containing protein [Streptomyces sp. WMMC500]|uniref:penicillin-binding transpeptidase domain-containing protein n=1 Tax=Streptomyces sp. WMMC500 TaxID=3015154 RepID=UPI00248AD3C4|nr:penicillin-binding transpeptidase domain-containing protein [Streptomyces sp. WMMC500]WBB64557.1 penicillin-binding transpeptidase domain-containing protein [Streptomyces sp. WMMC500]
MGYGDGTRSGYEDGAYGAYGGSYGADPYGVDLSRAAPVRRGRRRRRRGPVLAAVAVVLAGGGYWAATAGPLDGGADGGGAADPAARRTAERFLDGWSAGRMGAAAKLTDSPAEAERILASFTEGLEIGRPKLTAGRARADGDGGARVAYTAKMPVRGLGTWTYAATLPLTRDDGGTWRVRWELGLVHPKLTETEKFRLVREESAQLDAVDRDGAAVSAADHPSLAGVLGLGGGLPQGAVQVVDRHTGDVRSTEARFGARRDAGDGTVRTTVDAELQGAAEAAMERHVGGRNAGLVALDMDSGEVLAAANSPAAGFNRAFQGTYAPGSTWKVVTTAALLNKGAVSPGTTVDCPKYLTVGKRFHNVETSEIPGATFREDFIHSCNTAFVALRDSLGDEEMTDFAHRYFGIGEVWNTGVPSFDGEVPVPGDETEKAAALFGQGRLRANPLVMASVTATAATGTFRQPVIVEGSSASPRASAEPLPEAVVTQLRELMRDTVTEGSAQVLAGLPGDVGAKTGTAEVTATGPNNGWLVAYRDGVAVACVVEDAESGSGDAGPVVREVLEAVG